MREKTFPSKKSRELMRKVLSEHEIRSISRRVREVIGPILGEQSGQYGLNVEDSLRFQAVATRLREAREQRGIDLRAAAKALRAPQYRLRYIEGCNLNELRSSNLYATSAILA